ncbi:MAG TPA: hypothetical protein VF043_24365 [Ktedonobacteraceae bacterium]
MAESVTQPGTDHIEEPEAATRESKATGEKALSTDGLNAPNTVVIWTPIFMVTFALTFVVGCSVEALLAEGWLTHYYLGQWIMQVHIIVAGILWLALAVLARSVWVRSGGIFGCIWAIFMSIDILIISISGSSASPLIPHVNPAICIALFGAYICLSMNEVPFHRWDAWFFGLAPIGGILMVVLTFFLTPGDARNLELVEGYVAMTALILSTLVWWLRPSCWKAQPGPTFFFGIAPLILLLLAISNTGFNPSNFFLAQVVLGPPSTSTITEANFFFSEIVLLCLILGAMRVLRSQFTRSQRDQG